MIKLVISEFRKLKRYSVVIAGIVMMTLSSLMAIVYTTATDGTVWTYPKFLDAILVKNCTMFFPATIALIAGYLITRESSDDTLKNLLTVPISYRRLIAGKLIALLLLTVLFSLESALLGSLLSTLLGLPGMTALTLLEWTGRIIAANVLIYIATMPIIILTGCSENMFLAGVAIAFIYGFLGSFEGNLLNFYPIKACLILTDPTCGEGYEYVYTPGTSLLVLGGVLIVSMLLLACKSAPHAAPQKGAKSKKSAPVKGW